MARRGPPGCDHFLGSFCGFTSHAQRRVTVCVAVSVRRRHQDNDADQEIVELAALADGSLAPERRAALEERVAASSELADRLAEQQRAVDLARSAAAEVEAPASLRARIEAPQRARRMPMPRRLAWSAPVRRLCWPSQSGSPCWVRRAQPSSSTPSSHQPMSCRAPAARRRSPRRILAGRSSSTPPDFPGSKEGASTRRGSGTPPACSSPSGRSTRAATSRCGRVCRRKTSRP